MIYIIFSIRPYFVTEKVSQRFPMSHRYIVPTIYITYLEARVNCIGMVLIGVDWS